MADPRTVRRVVMVNKYYYPHLGGIEYHLHDLATALAARENWDVTAIVANEGPETVHEAVDGVAVTRVGSSLKLSAAPLALGFGRALRHAEAAADLVHLHSPSPSTELAWLRSRPEEPSVLSYHSDIVRQRILGAAWTPLLKRVLAKQRRIITSSPNMVEHSPVLSAYAEKCRIIPYGVHTERFDDTPELRERAAAKRALVVAAAGEERPVILFVGRLVYYKGAHVLIEALKHVEANLVVIGTGPLEGELKAQAAAEGVSERIVWLPPQPDDDLAAWYAAADIFCLPSVARSEAYGIVQVEAMAAGTPLVSTDLTTSVPFVTGDGISGITVPVGDAGKLAEALEALVTDDALRQRLGRGAYERARADFTIDRMLERTLAVYEEALA